MRPLKCVGDNDTRWLSQLYMIRRALKLRKYLERVLFEFGRDNCIYQSPTVYEAGKFDVYSCPVPSVVSLQISSCKYSAVY